MRIRARRRAKDGGTVGVAWLFLPGQLIEVSFVIDTPVSPQVQTT
ncbi:hypothetical protein ACFXPY_14105 [Streptomyces sp. NPDC059153]